MELARFRLLISILPLTLAASNRTVVCVANALTIGPSTAKMSASLSLISARPAKD